MPAGKHLSFSVKIGDLKQTEHNFGNKHYIAVDLHGKDSYTLEETEKEGDEQEFQKYPIAPFKLDIVKQYEYPCWMTIFMDGEKISSFPITQYGQTTRSVNGYKTGCEIRELAFSLPRISNTKTLTNSRLSGAGCLRVSCQEAIPSHEQTVFVPERIDCNNLPTYTSYPQLTKRDMNSLQGGMGVVCREGRTLVELCYDKGRYQKRTRLTRGVILEEIVLFYGSKEALIEMGVLSHDPAEEVATQMTNIKINDHNETDVPKSNGKNKEKASPENSWTKSMKQETIENCNGADGNCSSAESKSSTGLKNKHVDACKVTVMNFEDGKSPCRKSPRLCEDPPESPIAFKHEQMKQEVDNADLVEMGVETMYDEDDDDIVYVETTYMKREPQDQLNDSVIYMGDDSCCEVELPEEEVSIVDLCDD